MCLGFSHFWPPGFSKSNQLEKPMNAMEVRRVAKIPHGTDCGNTSRLRHLEHHSINASDYLNRHVRGDWGDVPADDAKENEFALTRRLRIISSYVIEGEKVLIITEADRSVTTLLSSLNTDLLRQTCRQPGTEPAAHVRGFFSPLGVGTFNMCRRQRQPKKRVNQ